MRCIRAKEQSSRQFSIVYSNTSQIGEIFKNREVRFINMLTLKPWGVWTLRYFLKRKLLVLFAQALQLSVVSGWVGSTSCRRIWRSHGAGFSGGGGWIGVMWSWRWSHLQSYNFSAHWSMLRESVWFRSVVQQTEDRSNNVFLSFTSGHTILQTIVLCKGENKEVIPPVFIPPGIETLCQKLTPAEVSLIWLQCTDRGWFVWKRFHSNGSQASQNFTAVAVDSQNTSNSHQLLLLVPCSAVHLIYFCSGEIECLQWLCGLCLVSHSFGNAETTGQKVPWIDRSVGQRNKLIHSF